MYMFIMTNILNHTKFKHIYDTFYERLLPQATQNSREKNNNFDSFDSCQSMKY